MVKPLAPVGPGPRSFPCSRCVCLLCVPLLFVPVLCAFVLVV